MSDDGEHALGWKRQRDARSAGTDSGESAGVPGRTANTSGLPPGANGPYPEDTVQRRAATGADVNPATARQMAGEGVSDATAPLPHAATIQRAFGRHDVSSIKVALGGKAANTSRAMNAHAYTQGDRIAFAEMPDLHTAAHEAAHVIQQRAGYAPAGGLDTPGDALERHADTVADAVIAGESAEALLDAFAGGTAPRSDASAPSVQRKSDAAGATTPHALLERFLAPNANRVWREVGTYFLSLQLPEPHERLTWVNQHAFIEKLLKQLEANMGGFAPLGKFDEILHPTNALGTLGPLVPSTPWSPRTGLAVAHALHIAVVGSVKRLALRYLQVADSRGVAGEDGVTPELLITSMPMDRYVAVALCAKGAVTAEPLSPHEANAAKGRSVALRPVKLTWEGARDPKLWNWVRTEPADATPEEVAAKLWVVTDKHGDTTASFNAYLLAAAAPLFGVPKRFAVHNPNMKAYAPADALADTDSLDTQLIDVAVSSAADDIALNGAGASSSKDAPADKNKVIETLGDCKLQLDFVETALTPWHLEGRVAPASAFVVRKSAETPSMQAKDVAQWKRVIDGQKDRLVRISGAINLVSSAGAKLGISNTQDEQAAPLREILELLAVAAGTSHLGSPSEARLQEAMQLQAALSVRAVQATERTMLSALDDVHAQVGSASPTIEPGKQPTKEQRAQLGMTAATRQMSHDALALQDRSRALQMQMLSGQQVDSDELEDVSLRSEELALDARLLGTLDAIADLNAAAREAGKGDAAIIASMFSGSFRSLPAVTKHLFEEVSPIRNNLNAVRTGFDAEEKHKPAPARHKQNQADRRRELNQARDRFTALSANKDLAHFFKNASEVIKNQQFRAACVRVAAMIGVSVVAGAAAGLAARAVGGMLMEATGAATVNELSLVARTGIEATRLGVDTTISSAGTAAIEGADFGEVWKQNLITSLASSAVFGSFSRYAAEQAAIEGRIAKTWAEASKLGKVGKVLQETGAITAHTLWGAAMGEVAGRIATGKSQPPPETLRDWALQGISVAVGRHVSHQLTTHSELYRSLEDTATSAGRSLVKEAAKLQNLARRVISGKQPKLALQLLEEHDRFLRMQIEELDRKIAKGGDHDGSLADKRRHLEVAAEAASSLGMIETKFVLAGMEELVPGALWKGSRDQIDAAIADANRGEPKPTVSRDSANKRWRITVGERVYEIQEVVSSAKSVNVERVVMAGDDAALANAAKLVAPVPGTLDVVVHGTVDDFVVTLNDQEVSVDHRRLANYIKSKGVTYERVRLVACKAGKHPKGAAQHLANKLGVRVLAPSDTLWIHPDGTMTIGPTETRNTGHWIEFVPLRSESRFRPAAQKSTSATPEHAQPDSRAVAVSGDEHARKPEEAHDAKSPRSDHQESVGPRQAKPRRDNELRVQKSDVVVTSRKTSKEWIVEITVPLPNGNTHEPAYGHVLLDSKGQPEGGPEFYFDKRVHVQGAERKVQIYDGGRLISLSDFALDATVERFKADFGHVPDVLPGSLAFENRANFQRQYALAKQGGENHDDALQTAIRAISFGRARAARGYDQFEITTGSLIQMDLGPPLGTQYVPDTPINIQARKKST